MELIGKAKKKKRTKTDKSKGEGKIHRKAEAAAGKRMCPWGMTQEKTSNVGWEVSQRIIMNLMRQTTYFESF